MVLSTLICLCLEPKVKTSSQAACRLVSSASSHGIHQCLQLCCSWRAPTNPVSTTLHSCWHLAFHSTHCTEVKLQNDFLGGHLPLRLILLKVQIGANLSTSPILWYYSSGSFSPLFQKHELLYHRKKSACLEANPKLWKTTTKKTCHHSQRKEIGRRAVP